MKLELRLEMLTQHGEAIPADALWAACATARGLALWQADEVRGEVALGERLMLRWPQLGAQVSVQVQHLEPLRRLALATGDTTLSIEVSPGELRLSHDGVQPGDQVEGTRSSWILAGALLAHGLTRHAGLERRVAWYAARAAVEPAAIHAMTADPRALAAWLGDPGRPPAAGLGPPGAAVELALLGGATLRGRVLCNVPGRDLAWTWSELDDSVLALRTLPAPIGDGRLLALVHSTWTGPGARAAAGPDQHARLLRTAVDRLARLMTRAPDA